jgi:PAS domain-containing protein
MLAVVMITLPMILELLQRNENANTCTFRLIVATAAIVLLAGGAYLKEYLDKRELASEGKRAEVALRTSEERFRLAAQAGRMYAMEWDVATDGVFRSGDLPGVLGLKNEDLGPTLQEFLMRVHSDDRLLVAASLRERVPNSLPTRSGTRR